MNRFALLIVAVTLFSGSVAQAASYRMPNGNVVDPILNTSGSTHSYNGINLTPGANLTNANLTHAILFNANLSAANLTDANLTLALLDGVNLTDANLTDADLAFAILSSANLAGANLTDANLTHADLINTVLYHADLTGANLFHADLANADLASANLTGADLTKADLTDVTSGGIVGSPSDLPANWQITQGYLIGPEADLTNAVLTNADLASANLTGATLTGAVLTGVSSGGIVGSPSALPANWQMTQGYLIGPEANLTSANLSHANLTNATPTNATLTGANLHQALLPSAMPSLPVTSGAVGRVLDALAVAGPIQVDMGGNLSVSSDSLTASGVNMQGGTIQAAIFGLDLDEIGDISGHGRLFGDVDLGTDGAIAGSGTGLVLYGDVSGSGTISSTTLFGNLNIGSSPGVVTLENTTLSASSTTTFEVAGTDSSQFDQLILIGSVALNGTAQITFDNFTPDPVDTFQLLDLTGGTASSWFSNVVAPERWTLSTDGLLAIPEPSSALLLGIGILCVAGYRRDSLV